MYFERQFGKPTDKRIGLHALSFTYLLLLAFVRMDNMQADLQQLHEKIDGVQSDLRKLKSRIPKPKVPKLPPSPNLKPKSRTSPNVMRKRKRSLSTPPPVPPIPSNVSPTLSTSTSNTGSPLVTKNLASLPEIGQSIARTTQLIRFRKLGYQEIQARCLDPPNLPKSALVKYQKTVQRLRQRLRWIDEQKDIVSTQCQNFSVTWICALQKDHCDNQTIFINLIFRS